MPPPSGWNPEVDLIQPGEPVNAAVTDRPLAQLSGRDQYLKDRLDGAGYGQNLIAFGATVAPAVLVNQPVAWNTLNQRFEPALAQAIVDPETGAYVAGPVTDCLGICSAKTNSTEGDILLFGRCPTDLSNAVAGTPVPGRYYLSTANAGMLTQQRPPIAVPVLFYDGTYAYVGPTLNDFLKSHVHFRIPLFCRPAGTWHTVSGRQEILVANATLPGWLPANDPSFGGQAPTGAVFGYNLKAHPQLNAIWPPQPTTSCVFVWDKGLDETGATIVPFGPDGSGIVFADDNGIWWYSDCVGTTPWPSDYTHPLDNSIQSNLCPWPEYMSLYVSFTEMLFQTDQSVVTSLQKAPATGALAVPLTVTDLSGHPANTGDLQLGFNLPSMVAAGLNDGSLVCKGVNDNTLLFGNVVEGLIAGANVTLTPTISEGALAQGKVQLDVATNLSERELLPKETLLEDALARPFNQILAIGFPANRNASIRMMFCVPYAGLPGSATVVFRSSLLGTTSGTLPLLGLTYLRLARPVGSTVLPTSQVPVAFPSNVTCVANQYLEINSDPISVTAGDTLYLTLSRSASDGYAGEVDAIRYGAVVMGS